MQKFEIERSLFFNFALDAIGNGNAIYAWEFAEWLELITENKLTIVEKQFIIDLVNLLDQIQINSKITSEEVKKKLRNNRYTDCIKFDLEN
jgi:Asp-tRNA(Asn)/Glu-tRNA(Gln) amidotransferase B subunit